MSWLSTLIGIVFVGTGPLDPGAPELLSQTLAPQGVAVAQQAETLETIADESGGDLPRLLSAREFNVVVLQPTAGPPGEVQDTIASVFAQAAASAPGVRVFLSEPLTFPDTEVGHSNGSAAHQQWQARVKQDVIDWQTLVDEVNKNPPPEAGLLHLVPLARAMLALDDAINQDRLAGVDNIGELFPANQQPGALASYFLTMVRYGAITGESPEGLPRKLRIPRAKALTPPTPVQAQRLQEIAWQVVQEGQIPGNGTDAPLTQQLTVAELEEIPKVAGDYPLAVGLNAVSDWSPQHAFLDVFKTARAWIGHLPGQFGGVGTQELRQADYLDENGWLLEIPPEVTKVSALILTDLPENDTASAGRYRLTFDGKGIIELGGRATNVRYAKNEVNFDFEPGAGFVEVIVKRTASDGNHVRNIAVVHHDHIAAFDAGAVFNPLWLDRLEGFEVARMMGWMGANDSTQSTWENRPKPNDFTYTQSGIPLEIIVDLLNRTGMDGWFNIPHLADDDYVRRAAELVKSRLWVEQKAYLELSNEVWNWQFAQAHWANEMGRKRWDDDAAWVTYYALRSKQISEIWSDVFADQAKERLVRIISTQTGWIGLEEQILDAPLWRSETPDNPPMASFFDAYAITGYFSSFIGTEERAPMVREWLADSYADANRRATENGLRDEKRQQFIEAHRFDLATERAAVELYDGTLSGDPAESLVAVTETIWPYHAALAQQYGLDLIMYEGGTHVVGTGSILEDPELTEFFIHLNYSPQMGRLYSELLDRWYAVGGTLFNVFQDVQAPSKWGSWGHLRHLEDDNMRWRAVEAYK